ncbi:MAG: hypothetical protein NXI22_06570 [bacterium]|nr:hypothetical protein [bacterium]
MDSVLKLGDQVTILPIIHGSGDCAIEVRRVLLEHDFDCVAVPLPPSFQVDVEAAIAELPAASIVIQRATTQFYREWTPEKDLNGADDVDDDAEEVSYVPVDPCQPVIAALRSARGEHIATRYIDLETNRFEPYSDAFPDAYALKQVSIEKFAAAILPAIERPEPGQRLNRIVHMANRLRELEGEFKRILLVCSVLDWPWIREAYSERHAPKSDHEPTVATERFGLQQKTLTFMLGELPYITGLYERARAELEADENLSVDGIKELLISARDSYRAEFGRRARKITPHMLRMILKYVRNLSLMNMRLTPDLYSLVVASQQIAGDGFAIHVAETAGNYPYHPSFESEQAKMGMDEIQLPSGEIFDAFSRLPGADFVWGSLQLNRRAEKIETEQWKQRWNPYSQCSWPPEDEKIENFRAHVFERAQSLIGADLAKTEKFTTSVMDGIDIRETLRHWYDGDIYVKVEPPSQGNLDCVVMLFDSPADPRDYPWRTTWYAEHQEESTLAFFASNFADEMVGPGIALANYGGAMFLFPPKPIPDIWTDPRFDFAETLEERLLAAACHHADARQIALVSPLPPGAGWRRLARRFKKQWVHMPLSQFNDGVIQQLRMVHVLNGHEVRSFAADFIRKV